ncbi:MAG: FAD-dependent oxidoreductase, partial [Nitrosopumilus sp.]
MSEEYNYDLVVVGGGPAGSSAAFAAAKNGIKVALIEKENSIA